MMGYDKNMKRLGETSSAAEMFLENKEQKAKREHANKRASLERELIDLAKATGKMTECIALLVGGDRTTLTTAVNSASKTFDEMIRTYNVLSRVYAGEENANKATDH